MFLTSSSALACEVKGDIDLRTALKYIDRHIIPMAINNHIKPTNTTTGVMPLKFKQNIRFVVYPGAFGQPKL